MSKIWNLAGRVAFCVTWPALFVYMLHGERTRVVIRCADKVLAVRGWLGDGKWVLPGGGLHISEPAAEGAIREVYEETGVVLKLDDLHALGSNRTDKGFRFRYHMFAATLSAQPPTVPQKHEIIEIAWLAISELQLERFEYSSRQTLKKYLA